MKNDAGERDGMAFDKAYFDTIRLDAVRGKFYRKSDVDALLKEISARAELQAAENEISRLKADKLEARLKELEAETDGAKDIARTIVSEAREEAERVLAEAREQADAVLADADEEAEVILGKAEEKREAFVLETMRQQEQAVSRIEEVYSSMKEQHAECIESINRIWQEFLSGLTLEEGEDLQPQTVPDDLEEKVGAIAEVLSNLE